jgi:hypothetical protein
MDAMTTGRPNWQPSDRYLLVEAKLGKDLAVWLHAQREAGKSLYDLVYELRRDTAVSVTVETVRQWLINTGAAAK